MSGPKYCMYVHQHPLYPRESTEIKEKRKMSEHKRESNKNPTRACGQQHKEKTKVIKDSMFDLHGRQFLGRPQHGRRGYN